MRRALIIAFAIPLLLVVCLSQIPIGSVGRGGGSTGPWSLISLSQPSVINGGCSPVCPALTVTTPAALGNLVVAIAYAYNVSTVTRISAMSGLGNWAFPTNCNAFTTGGLTGTVSCAWVIVNTVTGCGATCQVTPTLNVSTSNQVQFIFREYHLVAGTIGIEGIPTGITSTACGNTSSPCTTPTATITGSSDLVIGAAAVEATVCGINAPFGNFANPFGEGSADHVNTTSGTGASFTQQTNGVACVSANANANAAMITVAFTNEGTTSISLSSSSSPNVFTGTGQTLSITYVITNTGNTTLTGIFSITDAKAGNIANCGNVPGGFQLPPGVTLSCSQNYITTTGDDSNTITFANQQASLGSLLSNPFTLTVPFQSGGMTISVLNPGNGLTPAKCDGTSDDQPPLQAMINYASLQASPTNIWTLTFPANATCLLNSIDRNLLPNLTVTLSMRSNITLLGLGSGASRTILLQGPGGRPAPCNYQCTPYVIGFTGGVRWDQQSVNNYGNYKAINPFGPGQNSVTVQNISDANGFSAGQYVILIDQKPGPGCQNICDVMEMEFHTIQSVNTSTGVITLVDPTDWTFPPVGTTGRVAQIVDASAGALRNLGFKNLVVRGAAGELIDQLVYSDIENSDFLSDLLLGQWNFTDQWNAMEYSTYKNNLVDFVNGNGSTIGKELPQRDSAYNIYDGNTWGDSAGRAYGGYGNAELVRHETFRNNIVWTNPGPNPMGFFGFAIDGIHSQVGPNNVFHVVAGGNWNNASYGGVILDTNPVTTGEGQNGTLFRGDDQYFNNSLPDCAASGASCMNYDGGGNAANSAAGMGNTAVGNTITIITGNNATGVGTFFRSPEGNQTIINNNTINLGTGVGVNWTTGMTVPCSVQNNTTVPANHYGTLPGPPCVVANNH